jgi:ribosomal protein S18 acetylase RimI-like enzyme
VTALSRFGDRFWLTTWVHNSAAIGFYQHFGFKDIGEVDFCFEGEAHENRALAYNKSIPS